MNEMMEVLTPYMKKAHVPMVESLYDLNVDQIVSLLVMIVHDPLRLDGMGKAELGNLLEQLRCEYFTLLNNEPEDDCVASYKQWHLDMAALQEKMTRVEQKLAA